MIFPMVAFDYPGDVSVGESTDQPPHRSPVSSSPDGAFDLRGRFWERLRVLFTSWANGGF
jgi:hypothetical protein